MTPDKPNFGQGFTLWFTGLPCSGKTTLAQKIKSVLLTQSFKVELLDGDEIRTHLSQDLGYSKKDRFTNIRRVGYVCGLLSKNGVVAVAALVSPYEKAREEIRKKIENFVLVYVKCPLDIVKKRDKKGHYEKALQGKIKNFTGVSDPYEVPKNPDIVVETDKLSIEECADKIIRELERLGRV